MFPAGRPRRRPVLSLIIAVLVAAAGLALPAAAAHAAAACRVQYAKSWDNGSGFGAAITITNLGDPITSWTLGYTWAGNQRVTQGWSGVWSQSGSAVTVRNAAWNGAIATGSSVMIGFNGSYTGTNTDPSVFTVNGTACTGQPAVPDVVVEPTAVTVPEGRTATYAVRLSSAPSASVTVTSTAGPGDTDITVSAGATLTFTPQNWQTNQTVTVAAAADTDTINGTRTIAVRGPGPNPVQVVATESDSNIGPPTPIIAPTVLLVPEGGSATVSVRLAAQPAVNLTLTITGGSGDPDLTVCAGAVLTFTPANWNTSQTFRICAAEDADSVNGTRTFVLAGPGLAPVTITATEVDNDPPAARADNPFAGASGYVNPDWQDQVNAVAAGQAAPLGDQMRAVGAQPTAVWLDRIAAPRSP